MSYLYGIVGIYSMQSQFFSAFPLAFFSFLLLFPFIVISFSNFHGDRYKITCKYYFIVAFCRYKQFHRM